MYREFIELVKWVLPDKNEGIFMTITGTLGSMLAWALGGFDLSLHWLFIFVCLDYAFGMIAAIKTGEWSSKQGFKGILKKVFIFLIVAICHGLDKVSGIAFLRNAAITAYALNEVGSILENLVRMGYEKLIPDFLYKGLKIIKKKQEIIFNAYEKQVDKEYNAEKEGTENGSKENSN